MTTGAESFLRAETEDVLVTEWRLAPGAGTGQHRHNFDYVVVPLTYGRVKVVSAAGEAIAEMQAGVAYARKAGVEHDVVNAGEAPLSFVEVELKGRPG
jgi:beta-alanine degradation protein BauB